VGKAIPFMPVAERITVDTASTIKLVPVRKPLASSGVSLTEVSMVAAGKMTSASVASPVSTAMTAAAVASPVSTAMTAAASTGMTAAAMTATAMAAATMAAATMAPRNLGRQSQRPERNSYCQNSRQLAFHGGLPVNTSSETSTQKRSNRNIVARIPLLKFNLERSLLIARHVSADVRFGSWLCKNAWREAQISGLCDGRGNHALIAAINGWMPMMFMTRVRL
jgi:hypothetical protein